MLVVATASLGCEPLWVRKFRRIRGAKSKLSHVKDCRKKKLRRAQAFVSIRSEPSKDNLLAYVNLQSERADRSASERKEQLPSSSAKKASSSWISASGCVSRGAPSPPT